MSRLSGLSRRFGGADGPASGRSRRWLIGMGIATLLMLGYTAAAWVVSGRVPRDTTIAGVDVSGRSAGAAERRLAQAVAASGSAPVQVSVDGRPAELAPAAAGLRLDPEASVDAVTAFSLNPVTLWRHLDGGGRLPGAPAPQDGRLQTELRRIASGTDQQPTDAGIRFSGSTASVQDPASGRVLDIDAAAGQVRTSWLGAGEAIRLPVVVREPEIGRAEAEQALSEVARPALEGDLKVAVGRRTVTLAPEGFARALSMAAVEGELQLAVDGQRLRAAVLERDSTLASKPRNAELVLRDRRPKIIPARTGVTIDPEQLASAAQQALGDSARTATVKAKTVPPKVSTDDIRKLGVRTRVSTFSTVLTADSLRTENLTIAARTVSGTLVKPGETFSLNGVLGERTPAKGYNQAPAISNGRLIRDYGGGVSQMATTIFNNVFFAGLDDIYHKPHSFYISRYPEGREATVNWPGVDLKWRNDSKYAVLIESHVGGGQVHVNFWSTKVWTIKATKSGRSNYRSPKTVYDPKPGCVPQEPQSGFDVSVRRLFYRRGSLVKSETFRTAYIAEDKVVCGRAPAGD